MSLTLVDRAKPGRSLDDGVQAKDSKQKSPGPRRRRRRGKRRTDCLSLTETRLDIRFADVDMMRVVHHSAYLHWFEKIRFNALHNVFGISFEMLDTAGLMLPLTSCEVHYLKPFQFTQQPVGYAEIEVHKRAMFSVHYFVYCDQTDQLHTTGQTRHCYLNRDARLLVNTPVEIRDAFDRVVAEYPQWVRHGD